MKQILLLSALLTLLIGCERPASYSSQSWSVAIDSTSAHQRAWVMFDTGASAKECIAMQQKAIDDMRAGLSDDDPVEVLAQMGQFYNCIGDYRRCIEYLQEAETYIQDHPEYKPEEGAIQLYGELGDLYRILGMIPESKEAFRKSFAISNSLGGRLLTDLYCFAAATYDEAGEPDSVMYCYDMALKAIDDGKTRADKTKIRENVLSQRADYMISSGLYPDSIESCIRTLEAINYTSAWMPSAKMAALGNAYIASGRVMNGIGLLEQALNEAREDDDVDAEMLYLQPLMKAYAGNGVSDRLTDAFMRYDALRDTLLNREKLLAVTGADLRYHTSLIRDKNRILEMEMTLMRQRIVYGVIVAILLIIAVAAFLILKRRNYHRVIHEKSTRIKDLIDDRIALNTRIERLNEQLSGRETSEDKLRLQPILLEKSHENEFRKTFNEAHPEFIHYLRRDFPGITPGQEIICMLIYLYKNNAEIALALGISRDSVIKSRYRIRQRFGLSSDADLDTFIRER